MPCLSWRRGPINGVGAMRERRHILCTCSEVEDGPYVTQERHEVGERPSTLRKCRQGCSAASSAELGASMATPPMNESDLHSILKHSSALHTDAVTDTV